MLVLSRKVGQKIIIGDNITVYVSRIAGHRVTLGLEAPSGVNIRRGELKPREPGQREHPDAPPGGVLAESEIRLDLSGDHASTN